MPPVSVRANLDAAPHCCALPWTVQVFGNSETFKRLPLPSVVESVSRFLRASIVLFFGRWGLPVPFKVREEPAKFGMPHPRGMASGLSSIILCVYIMDVAVCRRLTLLR